MIVKTKGTIWLPRQNVLYHCWGKRYYVAVRAKVFLVVIKAVGT